MNKPSKVIAYCRVSTTEQATEGVSLPDQEARIKQYAALYGLEVTEVIVDRGESGGDLDRPGMIKLRELVKARKVDGVVVTRLDRLTRKWTDLADLVREAEAGKVTLYSVTEQIDTSHATGRMMIQLLGMMAEWEREAIIARVKAGMKHKKAAGGLVGSVPYGKQLDEDGDTLVDDDLELETASRTRQMREQGMSYRAIGLHFAERGITSRNGKPFAPQQLKRMIAA